LLDCIVLGDSIALGLSQARPDCEVAAEPGITSERFVQTRLTARQARVAIISLGVNDVDGTTTANNLELLRGTITAVAVYWLAAGSNPLTREAIRSVAERHGDRLIDVAPLAGPDHIHPDRAGYATLATQTGAAIGGRVTPAAAPAGIQTPAEAFRAFPDMKIWNGPGNLNGVTVNGPIQP
jgi:hypothetical protein